MTFGSVYLWVFLRYAVQVDESRVGLLQQSYEMRISYRGPFSAVDSEYYMYF